MTSFDNPRTTDCNAPGPAGHRASARLALLACAAAALAPQGAQAYSISGTYDNSGAWNDSLYIMTTGRFNNLSGGVLDSSGVTNVGILDNRLGGVINNRTRLTNAVVDGRQLLYNYGSIHSTGTALLENYGLFYNYAGATLDSAAGVTTRNFGFITNIGSCVNAGQYEQTWANITGAPARKLVNSGTLANSGSMSIGTSTAFENSGQFSNTGSFSSATTSLSSSGSWLNAGSLALTGSLASGMSGAAYLSNTGTLTNTGTVTNLDGTVRNYGRWVNQGSVNNTSSNYIGDWGRFTNHAGASLVNEGTISTNHVLDNAGSLTNTGTLSASYQLNNLAGATLTSAAGAAIKGATYNYGRLDNQGSIEFLDNHGVFNNLAGASQHNSMLVNRGSFTNAAGASLSGIYDLSNVAGATLVNDGSLYHWYSDWWPGTTTNDGTLLNRGSISNQRTLRNTGTLVNEGSLSGNGSFVQTAGSSINTGQWSLPTLDIQGGSFLQRAGSLRADSLANAGLFMGTGTLQVGRFSNAGIVAPGEVGISLLAIDGQYVQAASGTLALALDGLLAGTEYESISSTGTATLAGTLEIALGFAPPEGARFGVLHADGGIVGGFDTLALPGLAAGLAWTVDYAATDVWLRVTQDSTVPVPEPGAGLLFTLGLAGLALVRARR